MNYVELPHTPRYYFGHGLSYTAFEYSDLRISEKEIDAQGSVRIAATVSNVGECEGDEVVQLYLIDRYASMTRPVKELAGFKRISLKPGEKKRVVFEVFASQTAGRNRSGNRELFLRYPADRSIPGEKRRMDRREKQRILCKSPCGIVAGREKEQGGKTDGQ